MFRIGAIGAGHMGMAVLDAMATAGSSILVYDVDFGRMKAAKERGFAIAGSESEVYVNAEILLLAVRPQSCEELLEKLSKHRGNTSAPIVVSVMAGISSKYIRQHLGRGTAVISVMPTIGMRSGHGAAAIAHTQNVPEDVLSYIVKVFAETGDAVIVSEPQLMEIVAVNGCMPGYVLYLLDAFARGAKGVDYPTAVRMAARGFMGAAAQVLEGGVPKELLAQVCTPGGLTAQGVESFEGNDVAKLLAEGMAESVRRGYDLSKN